MAHHSPRKTFKVKQVQEKKNFTLYVDVYDEAGFRTSLVKGQPIIDPENVDAEVLELYRNSPLYRHNDYIYFRDKIDELEQDQRRINLGPDRYIVYWIG